MTGPESSIIFLEGGRLQAAPVLGKGSSNYRIALSAGRQRRLPIAKALAEVEAARSGQLLAAAEERLARLNVSELHRRCDGKRLSSEQLARLAFDDDAKPAALIALRAALVADPGFFVSQGDLHQPVPAAQAQAVVEGRRRRQQAAQRQQRFRAGLERGEIDEQIAARGACVHRKEARSGRRGVPGPAQVQLRRQDSDSKPGDALGPGCRRTRTAPAHGAWPASRLRIRRRRRKPGLQAELAGLPLLAEDAFSIDGAGTIEIDDAFSVRPGKDGLWQIGIHIAAPVLGLPPAAASQAEQRMTSVYLPDRKIMQFPEPIVRAYALLAGPERPALSLLQDFDPASGRAGEPQMLIGRVKVAANLSLESFLHWQPGDGGQFSRQLEILSRFSDALPAGRKPRALERAFIVRVDSDSAPKIMPREQLVRIDAVVAALMVHYNRVGTGLLCAAKAARLLRSSGRNLVRDKSEDRWQEYAWLSSPLRRYIDLLNQQQLAAVLAGRPPPHDAEFMRARSLEYDGRAAAARRAQQILERYWVFRWLQEHRSETFAAVVSGCRRSVNLVDFPVAVKIRSPEGMVASSKVRVRIEDIDLCELVAHGRLDG